MDFCLGVYLKNNHTENVIREISKSVRFDVSIDNRLFVHLSDNNFKKIKDNLRFTFFDGNITETDIGNMVDNILCLKSLRYDEKFFCIITYDYFTQKLSLISDCFRSKAFYYFENKEFFLFSTSISELLLCINSYKVEMDWAAVVLNNNYSFKSNNVWKNIKEIGKSEFVCVSKNETKTFSYENHCFEKIDSFSTLMTKRLKMHKDTINAVSLSGGVDSMVLSKLYNVPSYSLSGIMFEKSGEMDIVKNFIKENKVNHTFVEIPDINSETIQLYKKLLYEYALPNFSIEMFFKTILCKCIYEDLGSCVFATGQGSDEIFGGYSANYSTYGEYTSNLIERYFIEKKLITNNDILKLDFFEREFVFKLMLNDIANERALILKCESEKLINNALVVDNFSAKVNKLNNIAPYVDIELFNYMRKIDGEILYDKRFFREYAAGIIGEKYAFVKKNSFIYNDKYYYSYKYIKSLVTYVSNEGTSLLDEMFNSRLFCENIFNKEFFREFVNVVCDERRTSKDNLYLIEVLLKFINVSILYEKYVTK